MARKIKDILNEDTLVPISLVLVFIGGVYWLSSLYFNTNANAKAIEEMARNEAETRAILMSIDQRLSRIEGKLDVNEREE